MRKFFHLEATEAIAGTKLQRHHEAPWYGDYTTVSEVVVLADDETHARKIASEVEEYFSDERWATCKELDPTEPAGVIIMNEPTG